MRRWTLLGLFAVLGGAEAQTLSDSLSYTGLPANPRDMHSFLAGNPIGFIYLFHAGCPSDGGYSGLAFAAVKEAAVTDTQRSVMRTSNGW